MPNIFSLSQCSIITLIPTTLISHHPQTHLNLGIDDLSNDLRLHKKKSSKIWGQNLRFRLGSVASVKYQTVYHKEDNCPYLNLKHLTQIMQLPNQSYTRCSLLYRQKPTRNWCYKTYKMKRLRNIFYPLFLLFCFYEADNICTNAYSLSH